MKTRCNIFLMTSCLVLLAGNTAAVAQTPDTAGAEDEAAATAPAQETPAADDAPAADDSEAADDATAADDTEAADEEAPPGEKAPVEAAAPAAGQTSAPAPGGTAGGQPATGPGGRPLRSDYPGTDEAMKPRMETDRIKGIDYDKLNKPSEVYDLRIKELETKIDDLKEKVFRSKSRVMLLKETLLGGKLAGSQAVVVFDNQLGNFFKLERALVSLDGANIYNRRDQGDGKLSDIQKVQLYNGNIAPGAHKVMVVLKVVGDGGMFSYFDDYEFTMRNSCPLTVEEGRASILTVTVKEAGNSLTAHDERPSIECRMKVADLKQAREMRDETTPAKPVSGQ